MYLFFKFPSKCKDGKTPIPTGLIIQDLTAALKQSRCSSPCCCPVHVNSTAEDNSSRADSYTPLRHPGHASLQKYTLFEPLICCCSINNKLWQHHKKKFSKSQVLLYFLHTKSTRFPREIAACCAPALRNVLVTALKHGSPQATRKATHGDS